MGLYAKVIENTKNDISAFLPQNGEISVLIGGELVNDTIDILNVKESEVSRSRSGYNSLGDMKGLKLEIGYSFLDNWYANFKVNHKELKYMDDTLENLNIEMYLRHQAYRQKNTVIALDIGVSTNIAKDMSFNSANMTYVDGDGVSRHSDYVRLEDTFDRSVYTRGIISYDIEKVSVDAYAGFKYTLIENAFDGSPVGQNNPEHKLKLTRDEGMVFVGFGFRHALNTFFTWELGYKYQRMLRHSHLKTSQNNHIMDLTFLFSMTKNVTMFVGGKMMTNQFNGEINYLYTTYTKHKFEHKYGYADAGFIFKF